MHASAGGAASLPSQGIVKGNAESMAAATLNPPCRPGATERKVRIITMEEQERRWVDDSPVRKAAEEEKLGGLQWAL